MKRILFAAVLAALLAPVVARAQCFPEASCRVTVPPQAQVVASGDTISDNACGSVKNVSAAGAVDTNATNTFTAPSGANAGCIMTVCNQSANTITLKSNANFPGVSAGDVALSQLDCVVVAQTGTQWLQVSAVLSNN